ncbi:MAG: hypothetical protein HY746_10250 [Elusimicrobia bacterium]|nr:hypothetical protein [Elusimicrobiota bacterium]
MLKDKENLEGVFNKICAQTKLLETRDLWPDIKNAVEKPKRQIGFLRQPLWSRTAVFAGLAVCAAVVVFFIPGASENIKNGIKKLFSINYSLQLRDSAEVLGGLLVTDAQAQEITINNMLLRIKVTSLDEKAVRIDVSIFKKQTDGSLKLLHNPAIVTLRGSPAEIQVSDEKEPVYRLKLTPREQKDLTAYKCALEPIKP